ncbi:MAG: hypothetical protein IJE91_02355 [Clostridia bacterium]|nr:hypothetical protein [Clostridia bacterium]
MESRRKILKKLKKSTAIKEATELDYNKDGSVQINVGLKEADDFFSPHAYKTYEFINPDVEHYIKRYEETIPINEDVSVDIYTETPTTNEEKVRIRKALKRHYAECIVREENKYKRELNKGVWFCVLGVVILLIEAIIIAFYDNFFLDTLLAVIGWLFLWDGLESLVYDRSDIKIRLIRLYRILNAKVHVRQYSKKIKREYGLNEETEE